MDLFDPLRWIFRLASKREKEALRQGNTFLVAALQRGDKI